ncbi:hypothetical protein EJ04DRAFT_581074 [Polyplosphaeria fusca]|uniref:Ricin B lectin domain-containing protein n=1 Tax=Polyplosphaeria fusca TaxID=682080 RepID=A0A9P4UUE9_9PLEO|nr:hypothetical protein EJ04DRAFT_581074 [Polyplosphaeria fusca]
MLGSSLLFLAFAATGLAQVMPEGYRGVYITSMVDATFTVVPKAATNGSTTVIQKLAKTAGQQWWLKEGATKIQLANSTLCMDAGAKANWKDMGNIYLITCADAAAGQNWNAMADGRIALVGASPQECIDLQYMRATANNPVGLYACAGLGNTGAKDKGINWPLVNATA